MKIKLVVGEDMQAGDSVYVGENGMAMRLCAESGKQGVTVARRDYGKGQEIVIENETRTPRTDEAWGKFVNFNMTQDELFSAMEAMELELGAVTAERDEWKRKFEDLEDYNYNAGIERSLNE